jgi:hypothetical protein
MTRLCSAGRHDRAIGARLLAAAPVLAVEPMMAFGVIIAVTRSSEARIIGNSHGPKDLPKEGRRKISRGQGEGGFDRDRKAVQCSRPNTIPNTIEPKRQSTKNVPTGRSLSRKSESSRTWSEASPPLQKTRSGCPPITIRRCTGLRGPRNLRACFCLRGADSRPACSYPRRAVATGELSFTEALTVHRRLHPCARKLGQNLFLIFGFGLASPAHGLLGILAELIGL